jgi:hypothetical protein
MLAMLVTLLPVASIRAQSSVIIFVTPGGAGNADGTSWANARDLQDALTNATAPAEIWVAAGSYRPAGPNGDRNTSFELKTGVAMYGGFAGTETARSQRDWMTNVTILSGDLNANDSGSLLPTEPSRADNSFHVVRAENSVTASAILDGFTITGAHADGSNCSKPICGNGVLVVSASPSLTNLIVHTNSAQLGGGLLIFDSSTSLSNTTVRNNRAAQNGGGIAIFDSSLSLNRLTIRDNTAAAKGGGLTLGAEMASGTITITQTIISGNSAGSLGAGLYNEANTVNMTNTLVTGNAITGGNGVGGGVVNFFSPSARPSIMNLTNVTISGNQAPIGQVLVHSGTSMTVRNSVVWGHTGITIVGSTSTITVISSLVQGSGGSSNWNANFGANGGGNLDVDPLFVASVAPTSAQSSGGDYRLRAGSPALDSGTSTNAPSTDLNGIARPQGAGFDMGAYERIAAILEIASGNNQSSGLEQPFAQALEVRLRDANNNPLANVPVSFAAPASGPGASLSNASATTNANGQASVTATANGTPGSYSVSVQVPILNLTATFDLTNVDNRQSISFAAPLSATYGDAPFTVSATASSGLPVSFGSATPGVCTVNGATVSLIGAGACTIAANQAGDAAFQAAPTVSRTVVVARAPLAISATDITRQVGQANPAFSVRYTGLVNGDTSSVVRGTLSFSTTASASSPVGSYTVVPSGLTSDNYAILFVPGMLTITDKQVPTVTWTNPASIRYGTALGASQLNASASVPGSFSYTLANGSPAVGTVLNAGNGQVLRAVFTPTDRATYAVVTTTVALDVTRAPLTIIANDATRMVGQANPAFSVRYTGLVNGDTSSVVRGTLSFSTTATATSPAGSYPIVPSGLTSSNYAITLVNGTLTVTATQPPPLRRTFLPLVER